MLRILILTIFTCSIPTILSQDGKWKALLSEDPIVSEDQGIPRILFMEQIENGYFVFREQIFRNFRRRKFIIERLDANLKSKELKDITELLNEQSFEIQEVLKLNDRLLLLSTKYLREEKQRAFYLQELIYESFELNPRIEVYRFSTDANSSYRIELIQSPNEQKIMFSVIPEKRVPWIKKAENDYRDVVILNRDLSEYQRLGRLEMRVGNIDFSVDQSLVTNEGVLFFMGLKIPDKKSEEPDFYLLRYQDSTLQAGQLKFTQGQIKRARIDLNRESKVLFTGYYYEMKRFNPGVGVVAACFNTQTLEAELINSDLIRNEVMMSGLSDRLKRKWQREIQAGRDLKLNNEIVPVNFFLHPSGDVSLIGEIQYVSIESTSLTQAGTLNRFTYNYEHIFVTRMNSEGKILWITKIPKLYRGSVDLIQTFHALQKDEHINIIFNDNVVNQFPNPKKGISYLSGRSKHNHVVNYQIDEKGKINNTTILEYRNAPYNKMNLLNMFSDAAVSSQQHLLFSTSGKMGYYYLLMKNEF